MPNSSLLPRSPSDKKKQAGEQCDDKENLYDPEKIMAFPD